MSRMGFFSKAKPLDKIINILNNLKVRLENLQIMIYHNSNEEISLEINSINDSIGQIHRVLYNIFKMNYAQEINHLKAILIIPISNLKFKKNYSEIAIKERINSINAITTSIHKFNQNNKEKKVFKKAV